MKSSENVRINELRRGGLIMKRFRDWKRWKLLLPLFMLMLFYPIYLYKEHDAPFLNAFVHGDLLLFSALLLFEISVEAKHIQHELNLESDALEGFTEGPRIFGILLIVFYGVMKMVVSQDTNYSKTIAYCFFCLSVTLLVVAYSIYAFWRTMEQVLDHSK